MAIRRSESELSIMYIDLRDKLRLASSLSEEQRKAIDECEKVLAKMGGGEGHDNRGSDKHIETV